MLFASIESVPRNKHPCPQNIGMTIQFYQPQLVKSNQIKIYLTEEPIGHSHRHANMKTNIKQVAQLWQRNPATHAWIHYTNLFHPNVTTLRSGICYRKSDCLTSMQHFTEIVPEEPLRWGLIARGVAKYSDVGHVAPLIIVSWPKLALYKFLLSLSLSLSLSKAISRKRYKIRSRIQLMTNWKCL